MKKISLVTVFAVITLGFLFNNPLTADDGIKKVLTEKIFTVNPDANLVVSHQHGNVYCNNWDKDEISVTVIAHTKTSNQEEAEKAFNRISWEVKGNSNEVIVHSKLSGKSGGDSPNVWVEIEIYMPKSINLNLSHKFGKAFIEAVNGTALISSDYGSINVDDISNPESKFKITYGDGQINTFMGSSLIAQYSQLSFDEAGDVSIRSEYSDVEGDEVGNTLIKLEGGTLNLDEAISIKGSSSFSSLNVDELESSLNIETGYGSLNIEEVSENFIEITVENNFGSVNIGMPESASYLFNAEATHGSIGYPENMANITYREKTTEKTILKGMIGSDSDTQSKVNLKCNYGSINITN